VRERKGGRRERGRERDIFSEDDARGDRCRPSALKTTMTLGKCALPAPYSILESSPAVCLAASFIFFVASKRLTGISIASETWLH